MKINKPQALRISILILCFRTALNAQVGINNTTSDPSAILDITSTDKKNVHS